MFNFLMFNVLLDCINASALFFELFPDGFNTLDFDLQASLLGQTFFFAHREHIHQILLSLYLSLGESRHSLLLAHGPFGAHMRMGYQLVESCTLPLVDVARKVFKGARHAFARRSDACYLIAVAKVEFDYSIEKKISIEFSIE